MERRTAFVSRATLSITGLVAIGIAAAITPAQAATINRPVEGNYQNIGVSSTIRNTFTGRESVAPGHSETRSYLVFDLTSVTSTITSASLRLELNGFFGTLPSIGFSVYDFLGNISTLGLAHAAGSPTGLANFADIGAGPYTRMQWPSPHRPH